MSDLAPVERLARLRALEKWLDWQLEHTRRTIRDLEQQTEAAYIVEKKIREGHPLGAAIHVADYTMVQRETRAISASEARKALTKDAGFFRACVCAPDKVLGLDR